MGKAREIVIPPGRLWPATPSGALMEIEVFGATGEYKSGKTLLGLSIAPGVHPAGHSFAGKPRTLLLDFEKSAGTYGGTGAERIDVPAKLMEMYGGAYGPLQMFNWFVKHIDGVSVGQYDVIMADPITDLDAGLVEMVVANPERYNLTKNMVERSGAGFKAKQLVWGAINAAWKQILLKLATRCKTFFFTSHMRDEFVNDSRTGKREPKGKETLFELASLYLQLERLPDAAGNVPAVPSGIVLKERLADTTVDPETGLLNVTQLMPPRLPQATVAAIRRYIACPPDYSKLKEGERIPEKQFSEEEKLRLEVARAQADSEAQASRLTLLQRQAELQAMARQAAAEPQPAKASDQTAERQAAAEEKRRAELAKMEQEAAEAKAKADAGIAAMKATEEKLLAETPPEHAGAIPPAGQPTAPQTTGDESGSTTATRSQVEEIRNLAVELGVTPDKLKVILSRVGVAKVSEMSRTHALALIEKLREAKAKKAAATPAPEGSPGN